MNRNITSFAVFIFFIIGLYQPVSAAGFDHSRFDQDRRQMRGAAAFGLVWLAPRNPEHKIARPPVASDQRPLTRSQNENNRRHTNPQ